MGFSFSKNIAKPFGTGVAAFLPGKAGDDARRTVKATYARLDAPKPIKTALQVLGPPTSGRDAALTLAFAGAGGAFMGRAAPTFGRFLANAGKGTATLAGVGAGIGMIPSPPAAGGPSPVPVVQAFTPTVAMAPAVGGSDFQVSEVSMHEPGPSTTALALVLALGIAVVAARRRR